MSTATASTTSVEALVRELYSLGAARREIARHALDELGSQGFLALGIAYRHGPVRVSDVAAPVAGGPRRPIGCRTRPARERIHKRSETR